MASSSKERPRAARSSPVAVKWPELPALAPSILSADFTHLADQIAAATEGGARLLHLDVMDGHFVPNMTIGPAVVESIDRTTDLPLDVHLMIEEPDRYIERFARAGADWISVHQEAVAHLHRTIHQIRECGAAAGVAINPSTPISTLSEILPEIDYVLVMSVNPGFGGQKFIPSTLDKIAALKRMIDTSGARARIEVDGGVGPENAADLVRQGAEILVAGSAVFDGGDPSRRARRLVDILSQPRRRG